MKKPKLRTAMGTLPWILAIFVGGCHSVQPAPLNGRATAEGVGPSEETRGVAEASLGKQAEILAQGDLAQNGREELLVVNRFSKGTFPGAGSADPEEILVTRATILEKNGGKWSEILRCDEHLKNPNGYLGGSPLGRVSGWQLEYQQDPKKGLELHFTPANLEGESSGAGKSTSRKQAVFVSWNTRAKRYQSLDRSHERYLNEVRALEPAESILR